uniref:MEMO1 family protein n=1 Tax=uncultured marine thaumarchaeote KM3_83_E04 TaxID=1456308 RepID=A0A075HSV8_9ARCH|nr:putative dioxygenase [uncultured marine thaumarchaeote KM3_83_E04]
MEVRTPAVSGTFYPDDENELRSLIDDCFMHPIGPGKIPPTNSEQKIYGVICPHAGFVYSGPVACHSFYSISSSASKLAIITGPNHYGVGQSIASMIDASWKTPLGLVEVDSESALELRDGLDILELDSFSHSKEHSIEVQVPMLQETFSHEMKILPISLINQEQKTATKVGSAIAKIAQKKDALLIGSSDFTHYEENEFAHRQDLALIDPILKLDVDEFYKILYERHVTACGFGAIASTMIACKELGATEGKLLKYATSGDVSGDKSSVVGYASIIFV